MKFLFLALGLSLISCSTTSKQAARSLASDEERKPLFYLTTSCAITCQGGSEQILSSERELFDPKNSPVDTANGNYVPTMTLRISNQADASCLQTAASVCGDVRNISSVQGKSVSSGRWSIDLPLDCKASNKKCALSPYQNPKLLDVASVDFESAFSYVRPSSDWQITIPNPKFCAKKVTFQSCFGDCASNDLSCSSSQQYVETLRTSDPGARDKVELCVDSLEARFQKEKTPAAIRPLLCRIYARKSILDQQRGDLSCTAFRINTDPCDQYGSN